MSRRTVDFRKRFAAENAHATLDAIMRAHTHARVWQSAPSGGRSEPGPMRPINPEKAARITARIHRIKR